MTTHVNPVVTLLGLALLAVVWRLGVFAERAARRAAVAGGAVALVDIPVLAWLEGSGLVPDTLLKWLFVGSVFAAVALVRFGPRFRTAVDAR